jgi:transposase
LWQIRRHTASGICAEPQSFTQGHGGTQGGGTEAARRFGIGLLYLPVYPSDLNPIEHFWSRLKTYLGNLLPTAKDPVPNHLRGI